MADDRAKRLLGDDLGQDDMRARVLEDRTLRRETRAVRRIDVAAVGGIVLARLGGVLDDHRLELHAVGTEEVGEVELGRRASLDPNRGAVEFLGALDAEILARDEALTVVIGDADELEAEIDI